METPTFDTSFPKAAIVYWQYREIEYTDQEETKQRLLAEFNSLFREEYESNIRKGIFFYGCPFDTFKEHYLNNIARYKIKYTDFKELDYIAKLRNVEHDNGTFEDFYLELEDDFILRSHLSNERRNEFLLEREKQIISTPDPANFLFKQDYYSALFTYLYNESSLKHVVKCSTLYWYFDHYGYLSSEATKTAFEKMLREKFPNNNISKIMSNSTIRHDHFQKLKEWEGLFEKSNK